MGGFSQVLASRLKALESTASLRTLTDRSGYDFSSNDYLGFSQDEVLREKALAEMSRLSQSVFLGSSGSRLLRGNLKIFKEVESELADFSSRESALIFPSGYQANLALFSALLKPQDVVFSDQYNHASIIDGIRLSGARKVIFPHSNVDELRKQLEAESISNTSLKVIATESLFGMDGDIAPLVQLADLAEEFSALLVVDEAHATGLWGDFLNSRGAGLVQHLGLSDRVFACIHPAGKALGVAGAWMSGDELLRNYLINFSRPFIFSTAPLPILPLFLRSSIEHWKREGRVRAREVLLKSRELSSHLREKLQGCHFSMPQVAGPILPLLLGENERALHVAKSLQSQGLDARAIRPPTVPEGMARVRLTVHWGQAPEEWDHLVLALSQCLR